MITPGPITVGTAKRTAHRNLPSWFAPDTGASTLGWARPAGIATPTFHRAPPSQRLKAMRWAARTAPGQPQPESAYAHIKRALALKITAAIPGPRLLIPHA